MQLTYARLAIHDILDRWAKRRDAEEWWGQEVEDAIDRFVLSRREFSLDTDNNHNPQGLMWDIV